MKDLFLAYRWPPSPRMLMWPWLKVCRWDGKRDRTSSLMSLSVSTKDYVLTLAMSFSFYYLLKPLSPNTGTLGIKTPTNEWEAWQLCGSTAPRKFISSIFPKYFLFMRIVIWLHVIPSFHQTNSSKKRRPYKKARAWKNTFDYKSHEIAHLKWFASILLGKKGEEFVKQLFIPFF